VVKFGQITSEDVLRSQRGDKEALERVLAQSYPLVYQLLSMRKYTPQIKTEEGMHQLVSDIRDYIEEQVIPSYDLDRGEFKDFLWNSIKRFLTRQSREYRKSTNEILTEDVVAAKEGDEAAMDFVIRSLDPMIKGIITKHPEYVRWVDTKEDLEDLFQHIREYLIRRGIPEFDPSRVPKATTYLYQVIRNELIDEGKRRSTERRQTGGPLVSLEAPLPGMEEETSLADILPSETKYQFLPQLYEAARAQMSDLDRKILDLRLQGFQTQEIVNELKREGVTTPTGKEIGISWLNTHYNTKIKPILERYIWGILPEQKLPVEEPPEEFLSEGTAKLSLRKVAEVDIITFLRLYLFE